jgi:Fe2+ transport system protein FeoA
MPQSTDPRRALPLTALRPRERGIIIALEGGRGLVSRMATMGFTPGAEVTMIQNMGRGPVIAMVRGGRVALGRGEAGKIQIRAMGDGQPG